MPGKDWLARAASEIPAVSPQPSALGFRPIRAMSIRRRSSWRRQVAKRTGWQVVGEQVDDGISVANGSDKRPAFDRS